MRPDPSRRTLNMPPLDFRAAVKTLDDAARTVEVTFSTGAAVERMDYWTGKRYLEKLSLDPAHVRLARLNDGAPLLNAHGAYSLDDVIGTVERGTATVQGKQGKATVRFSKRESVEPIYQDVRDGITGNVSIGYRVYRFEETAGKADQIPTRLATDWEPYEISLVPMGADAGAHVRGDTPGEMNPCVILTRDLEEHMDENTKATGQETPATDPPAPSDAQARAAIVAEERARITGIRDACRIAKLGATFEADLVGRGVTLDQARALIFAELAKRSDETPTNPHRAELGEPERDKWLRGAMNWLLVKSGAAELVARHAKTDVSAIDPGEFRGLTLIELAKQTLERAGKQVRGLDKMQIAAHAFTLRTITQGTSDFTVLLEAVMHKVLQAAYTTQPDTWRKWCAQGTVSDFRAHTRYRMGSFGALDSLTELGEFKHKAISDAEKATITAATKGNIISISRQVVVNDDMGALSRLLQMLGRAAGLSVEVDAYALLALNAGLGPTQSDNQPLFYDTSRHNVSTQATIAVEKIDLDRQKMAAQLDPWGNEYLDLRPAALVVNVALGGVARVINDAQYDPDTASKLQRPNMVRGLFRDIVDTPRVTGTRRYLFADPAIAPVFEVAFLEGQTSPVLETKDGWETDGAEMRVRFDYGVAAVDYRGAVTNAG